MKYSKSEINQIINLRDKDKMLIDIFDLHGCLYIMNPVGSKDRPYDKRFWDLRENCVLYSTGRVPISHEDFEYCENEDQINETFHKVFHQAIHRKLVSDC